MDTLFDINQTTPEYLAYQIILPYLLQTIEDNYAPLKGPKPGDGLNFYKRANFSSVNYYSSLLFRICFHKKQSYISFMAKKPELFSNMPLYQTKSEEKFRIYRCNLSSPNDIARYSKELCLILDNAIDNQPKECDICDLYMECSNAKKCVHWKREFSLHCGYKRILKSGRIYYGENRNVD